MCNKHTKGGQGRKVLDLNMEGKDTKDGKLGYLQNNSKLQLP